MADFSGIPRPFDVRQAKRTQEEESRRREQATSARNTSSTTVGAGGRLDVDGGDLTILNGGNASVKDGGRFLVEGGGSMDIVDDGEVTVSGQGIDGFTNEPIVSRLKFGNREAVHSWTGLSFLQPGVYLEGETPGNILETPRLTGVINRDGLMTRSGRRPSEGRPANIMEQSSALCTPWSASMGTIRYDSLINVDGEDGLAGREFDSSFSTIPGVANGMVEDVLNQRAYYLNLSADAAMATSGKTGAVLAISSWHMAPSTGWIRVDDGGLIDIQATVGTKTVGITSNVAGKLQLLATDGVNVQGPFTVDGNGVATTALATPTADGLMPKADKAKLNAATAAATANTLVLLDGSGRAKVANPAAAADIANKQYVDAADATLQTAINGKASTAVATSTADGLMPSTDKSKLDGSTPSPTAFRLMQRDAFGRAQVATPAAGGDAATKGYVDALTLRFQLVPGTSLPATVTSAWSNLASNVTVPADLFGAGVPYRISVFGQVQANPTTGLIISLRAVFNGATPAGAKVNGTPGPNNASVQVVGDFLVTTSQAVTVNCQASAPFGGVPRGSGDDAPFFTITVTPYLAL